MADEDTQLSLSLNSDKTSRSEAFIENENAEDLLKKKSAIEGVLSMYSVGSKAIQAKIETAQTPEELLTWFETGVAITNQLYPTSKNAENAE